MYATYKIPVETSPSVFRLQSSFLYAKCWLCKTISCWWASLKDWRQNSGHLPSDKPQQLVPICNASLTLRWRHNERDGVSNHQPHDCLLYRLFRCRSKKISKLRVTCLCAGNSPVTSEFPAQKASNAENVSFWWRHLEICTGAAWWLHDMASVGHQWC